MTREGSLAYGLLDDLHASGCDGTEYSACRPVVLDRPSEPGPEIKVVFMAWCSECEAADWDYV